MPFNWFKTIGDMDAAEGGAPIAEIDLDFRTLKVGQKLTIKTVAGSYTVNKEDSGKVLYFTAAATLTLPTPAAGWDGVYVDVYVAADVDVTIATETADTLMTFNDLAADSVAYSTSSEKIGAASRFFAFGALWHHVPMINEAATVTIVTA